MILDILTSLDKNLIWIIQTYGFWAYPLLFLVIFLETGLVVTPFLPGDSLLFAAGAIAAKGLINVFLVFIIAALAAIIGDTVNYFIGKFIGKKVSKGRFVKEEYLIRTQNFYDKYGTKTIILARFVPIVRTFAPFVAGI
jgi:membrane-associated protein